MTAVDAQRGDQLVVDRVDTASNGQDLTTVVSEGPKASVPPGPKGASKALLMAGPAALGALALWFLLFSFVLSDLQEHGSQTRLYERYRLELALETAPLGGPIKTGSPVAMISAPSGHIHNLVVVEGSTSRQLADGPGHLSDTPLPGQTGTSEILGRSVTYGAPFRDITRMKAGDKLTVTTGQGVFTYRVEGVRSPGDSLPAPLKTDQSRLTLVTSAGGGWRRGWAPTHTVYLDAILVNGKAQAVPAGLAATVSKASLPMHGDPSALVPLIFWVEALFVVAVAVGWSWVRWGRPQTWIAGVPIVMVVLWCASATFSQFLPNLL